VTRIEIRTQVLQTHLLFFFLFFLSLARIENSIADTLHGHQDYVFVSESGRVTIRSQYIVIITYIEVE
jgi:hypothetical protein